MNTSLSLEKLKRDNYVSKLLTGCHDLLYFHVKYYPFNYCISLLICFFLSENTYHLCLILAKFDRCFVYSYESTYTRSYHEKWIVAKFKVKFFSSRLRKFNLADNPRQGRSFLKFKLYLNNMEMNDKTAMQKKERIEY